MTCPPMRGCTSALRHVQRDMAPLTITETLPLCLPNSKFGSSAKATNLTYQIILDA